MTAQVEERRVADRRVMPPKSSKPVVVLGISLFLLAAWSGYQQFQLYQVTKAVHSDRVQVEIQGINDHLKLIDQELSDMSESQRQVLLRSDFESAHSSLVRQVAAFKQQLSDLEKRDDAPELLSLKAKLQSVEDAVKNLEKRVAALAVPRAVSQVKPSPARTSTPTKNDSSTPVLIQPPFQVIGIEIRGGERFLSVAPAGVRRLDQITLLRPGDIQQSWVLEKLGASTAEFRVNGTKQVVFVR